MREGPMNEERRMTTIGFSAILLVLSLHSQAGVNPLQDAIRAEYRDHSMPDHLMFKSIAQSFASLQANGKDIYGIVYTGLNIAQEPELMGAWALPPEMERKYSMKDAISIANHLVSAAARLKAADKQSLSSIVCRSALFQSPADALYSAFRQLDDAKDETARQELKIFLNEYDPDVSRDFLAWMSRKKSGDYAIRYDYKKLYEITDRDIRSHHLRTCE